MRRLPIPAILLFLTISAATAAASEFPRDEYQGYLLLQSQQWKSNDWTTGAAKVDDSGVSGGVGFQAMLEGEDWAGFWRTRLQGYKGFNSCKENTPSGQISADGDLSGLSAELDYLYKIPTGRWLTFEPVLGMALRMDRRTIRTGSAGNAADNTLFVRYRYREERRGFVGRLGLRAVVRELGGPGDTRSLDEGDARDFFVEGGMLVPVYVQYQGGLPNERIPSRYYPAYYLEAGARIGRWIPTAYYESFRYEGPSGSAAGTRAQSDVLGFRLGYAF